MAQMIAIDPGMNYTGLAKFVDGQLINVELLSRKYKNLGENIREQCRETAEFCWNFGFSHSIGVFHLPASNKLCSYKSAPSDEAAIVVVERPRIYAKSVVRANDIIDLATIAGALGLEASNIFSCGLVFVTAREWKGQTDKKVQNQRTLRKHPELEEMLADHFKSKHEHIIDAVGLGDYYLKEFGP